SRSTTSCVGPMRLAVVEPSDEQKAQAHPRTRVKSPKVRKNPPYALSSNTVDEHGRVHFPDEHRLWSNGVAPLIAYGQAVEAEGSTVQALVASVEKLRRDCGHEPAAVVTETLRQLTSMEAAGRTVPAADIAAFLRARAATVEREAAEAEGLDLRQH